jgi:hypothetical protein
LDTKTKGKVISALRQASRYHAPGEERKKRQKRDKALIECEGCLKLCYEGKSKKTLEKYKTKYPNRTVVMEGCQKDHRNPFIPIEKGWVWSWDQVIDNLFCDIDGYNIYCETCHSTKTKNEQELRRELRKNAK